MAQPSSLLRFVHALNAEQQRTLLQLGQAIFPFVHADLAASSTSSASAASSFSFVPSVRPDIPTRPPGRLGFRGDDDGESLGWVTATSTPRPSFLDEEPDGEFVRPVELEDPVVSSTNSGGPTGSTGAEETDMTLGTSFEPDAAGTPEGDAYNRRYDDVRGLAYHEALRAMRFAGDINVPPLAPQAAVKPRALRRLKDKVRDLWSKVRPSRHRKQVAAAPIEINGTNWADCDPATPGINPWRALRGAPEIQGETQIRERLRGVMRDDYDEEHLYDLARREAAVRRKLADGHR